jgi:hypothetical protein
MGNLFGAIGTGLGKFITNIGGHIAEGGITWLSNLFAGAKVSLPKNWGDPLGIIGFVLSLLGLSWDNFLKRIGEAVTNRKMVKLAKNNSEINEIVKGSKDLSALEKDLDADPVAAAKTLSPHLNAQSIQDAVKNSTTDAIKDAAFAGVAWITKMLVPASALIQAVQMVVGLISFLVDNLAAIGDFINSIIDSIEAIVHGAVEGAATLIDKALGKALPLLIDLLIKLLGLNGIKQKVVDTIKGLQKPVNTVFDKIIKIALDSHILNRKKREEKKIVNLNTASMKPAKDAKNASDTLLTTTKTAKDTAEVAKTTAKTALDEANENLKTEKNKLTAAEAKLNAAKPVMLANKQKYKDELAQTEIASQELATSKKALTDKINAKQKVIDEGAKLKNPSPKELQRIKKAEYAIGDANKDLQKIVDQEATLSQKSTDLKAKLQAEQDNLTSLNNEVNLARANLTTPSANVKAKETALVLATDNHKKAEGDYNIAFDDSVKSDKLYDDAVDGTVNMVLQAKFLDTRTKKKLLKDANIDIETNGAAHVSGSGKLKPAQYEGLNLKKVAANLFFWDLLPIKLEQKGFVETKNATTNVIEGFDDKIIPGVYGRQKRTAYNIESGAVDIKGKKVVVETEYVTGETKFYDNTIDAATNAPKHTLLNKPKKGEFLDANGVPLKKVNGQYLDNVTGKPVDIEKEFVNHTSKATISKYEADQIPKDVEDLLKENPAYSDELKNLKKAEVELEDPGSTAQNAQNKKRAGTTKGPDGYYELITEERTSTTIPGKDAKGRYVETTFTKIKTTQPDGSVSIQQITKLRYPNGRFRATTLTQQIATDVNGNLVDAKGKVIKELITIDGYTDAPTATYYPKIV